MPSSWQEITSICPSQSSAAFSCRIGFFARSRANNTLDFRKIAVSGELTYFPLFLFSAELPAAEGDHVADLVADRKHQPVPETHTQARTAACCPRADRQMPESTSSRPVNFRDRAQSRKTFGLSGIQPTVQLAAISLPKPRDFM